MPPKVKNVPRACRNHFFEDEEIQELRSSLLAWYDSNKRLLPWRTIAENESDDCIRGYAIWVSEVMLQQTQVATVVSYFDKWMKKWPTTNALSLATLDQINQMWSGLGYYSRGKRLWEGCRKVEDKMGGSMPQTAERLRNDLPGVGRYTAAAIASIAFKEKVGLVDGNVMRVMSRMRCIGADSSSKVVMEALWQNSNALVDQVRPGDFNQALMELGAVVCTPRNPTCAKCPVASLCHAFAKVRKLQDDGKAEADIEDTVLNCDLCFAVDVKYSVKEGVMNYPRKSKRTLVRSQNSVVILVANPSTKYLLYQRQKTGLLANLLEFPTFEIDDELSLPTKEQIIHILSEELNICVLPAFLESRGEVLHRFSHIKQTYFIWKVSLAEMVEARLDKAKYQKLEWLTAQEIGKSAISTAMKKVFQKCSQSVSQGIKRKATESSDGKVQRHITSFFSP